MAREQGLEQNSFPTAGWGWGFSVNTEAPWMLHMQGDDQQRHHKMTASHRSNQGRKARAPQYQSTCAAALRALCPRHGDQAEARQATPEGGRTWALQNPQLLLHINGRHFWPLTSKLWRFQERKHELPLVYGTHLAGSH